MFCAIDLLIGPVSVALNNLSLNVTKSLVCRSRWSMFSSSWGTLVTIEFSTTYFLERLNDDSKIIFLSALTSSNASCVSNCSLNRWVKRLPWLGLQYPAVSS